ncbi:MAG: MarR family transcriptional regulator [Actinomycetota bacterium]
MRELAGTGRHLSTTELRLWTSFLDAGRIIETELSRQLVEEFDMTHREYEVLVRVDGAGGEMRLIELARQIEASRALVSQTVDRLVERGWIERGPAPDDGRGVVARLLADGTDALASAAGPHAELVRELLLDPVGGDIEVTAEALGRVADQLRALRRNH